MRLHILMASVFAFTAIGCGQGYSASKVQFKSTAVDLSSEDSNDNPPSNPAPQLKTEELQQILSNTGGSLMRLITNLQGLGGGNFNFADGTASINKSLPCEISGSVNVTATATTDATVSATEISAALTNGTGTITFSACTFTNPKGGTIKLDGTASVTSIAGNFQIVLSGLTGPHTFNSANQAAVVGTIQVTTSELTKSCEITSSQQSVLNGTITPTNNFALNATATSTLSANICGTSITL